MKYIFSILLLATTSAFAGQTYKVKCFNDDIYTDLGDATLDLESTIIVNGHNDYLLKGGTFSFKIGTWTDQSVKLTKAANNPKYKPRNYKGYAQFPNIAGNFNGTVDLLIQHKDLKTGAAEFNATFIMTSVNDHWGDTLSVDCTLEE